MPPPLLYARIALVIIALGLVLCSCSSSLCVHVSCRSTLCEHLLLLYSMRASVLLLSLASRNLSQVEHGASDPAHAPCFMNRQQRLRHAFPVTRCMEDALVVALVVSATRVALVVSAACCNKNGRAPSTFNKVP